MAKEGMLEKIAKKGKEVFVEGTVFTWHNLPRVLVEQASGMNPQASANAMIGATAMKYVVAPAYEALRTRSTKYLEGHGFKFEGKNNGKKKMDEIIGFVWAGAEIAVNLGAYHFIYGTKSIGEAVVPAVLSTLTTGLPWAANLNGRLLDSALDARGLPNNGRSYFARDTPIERKREIMNTTNAMLLGFAGYYAVGTKLAAMISQ